MCYPRSLTLSAPTRDSLQRRCWWQHTFTATPETLKANRLRVLCSIHPVNGHAGHPGCCERNTVVTPAQLEDVDARALKIIPKLNADNTFQSYVTTVHFCLRAAIHFVLTIEACIRLICFTSDDGPHALFPHSCSSYPLHILMFPPCCLCLIACGVECWEQHCHR